MMQLPCASDMAAEHSKGSSNKSASHGTARSPPDGKTAASNSLSPNASSKSGQLQDAAAGCSVGRSSASTLSLGNTLPSSAAPSTTTSQQVRMSCTLYVTSHLLQACASMFTPYASWCQMSQHLDLVLQGGNAGGSPPREASAFQMDRHNVDGLQSYCRR
jgi:hypothetical protein